jgi:predicted MFS family arabinose efflux permease
MENNNLSKYRALFVSSFAFLYTFTRQTFLPLAQNINLPDFNNINYFFFSGNIASFFGLIYAMIQIPYGIAIDSFGINKTVLVLTGLMTIGLFICTFSISTKMFALGRLITLLGCGGAFISTIKTINNDLGQDKVKSITGSLIAISVGSSMIFIKFVSTYMNNNTWRYFYGAQGIFLLLIFIYFLILNRNNNEISNTNNKSVSIIDCIKIINNNKVLKLVALFSLFFLMIFYCINETSFMSNFLLEKLNFSSDNTFSLLLAGFFGGFFTTPMVVNKTGAVNYIYFLISILIILSILMLTIPNAIIAAVFLFIVGYSNGMQMILIDIASKIMPKNYVGILASIMNVLFVGGSFIPQRILFFVIPKIKIGSEIIFYGVIFICLLCGIITNSIKNNLSNE